MLQLYISNTTLHNHTIVSFAKQNDPDFLQIAEKRERKIKIYRDYLCHDHCKCTEMLVKKNILTTRVTLS